MQGKGSVAVLQFFTFLCAVLLCSKSPYLTPHNIRQSILTHQSNKDPSTHINTRRKPLGWNQLLRWKAICKMNIFWAVFLTLSWHHHCEVLVSQLTLFNSLHMAQTKIFQSKKNIEYLVYILSLVTRMDLYYYTFKNEQIVPCSGEGKEKSLLVG